MIVKSAQLNMSNVHAQAARRRERVDIEIFPAAGAQRVRRGAPSEQRAEPVRPAKSQDCCCHKVCDEQGELTPKWALLRTIVEALTGRLLEVFDASELQAEGQDAEIPDQQPPMPPPDRSSGGMRVTHRYEYFEAEAMHFQASGEIRTQDGQTISFELELQVQRSLVERGQTEVVWGEVPQLKDPLVINFDGRAAQLTSDRYAFDLDADGAMDSIPGLTAGRAYLVLDRNGNGQVDDGRELLGAISGDAFADLRRLDQDGNGFIDEADAAFESLGLWRPDQQTIGSLDSQQVAALSTQNVATEFRLDDEHSEQQGQLRATSIYLKDDGSVGTSQQIDFVV